MKLKEKRILMQKKLEKAIFESGYKLKDGEVVTGRDEKVEVICDKDHSYHVRYSTFMSGSRCDRCSRDKRVNKAKKKFLNILESSGYTLIGVYRGSSNKVEVMCDKGHVYGVRPYSFNRGHRCARCDGSERFTTEYFKEWVFGEVGDEYTVFGEYKNNHTKMLMRHNNESCENYEWWVNPVDFKNNGSRCPKCNNRFFYDTASFKKEVEKNHGNEFIVLGEYKHADEKIRIRHNEEACGYYEWNALPYVIKKSDSGCPKCNNRARVTVEIIKEKVRELEGDEYQVVSEKRVTSKFKIRHVTCGNEYLVTPWNFYQGKRCPNCKSSKGERAIKNLLDEWGIGYEKEKAFANLKDKKSLRYDFYISSSNLLIEYDGEQHFKPIKYSSNMTLEKAEKRFEDYKERDRLKNDYARKEKIALLRIPYWEFDNIEKIIKTEILEATY